MRPPTPSPQLNGTTSDAALRAEIAELRRAEAVYRGIFENAVEGIFQTTPEGRYLLVNPALARLYGYDSPADLIARVTDIARQLYVDPGRRDEFVRRVEERGEMSGFESQVRRKDGSVVWIAETVRVVRDAAGAVLYYEGMVEDVTARKRLEEQLLQSQKMEAIGKLAGGVAHDFNNLLTVIIGCADLMRDTLAPDDPNRPLADDITKAGEQAASLTRQLLAFGRKQVLQPRVISLNDLVADVQKMLTRLIGEDVRLATVLDPSAGQVKVDPSQMQQVLINLAVNSRDAMPRGGRLTVETGLVRLDDGRALAHPEVNPGVYVVLSVTDTGCGMDRETRACAFEPFFTTKPPGQGTGLGLSTVYGIVKQSGGYVYLYSEPNRGTTFKIYLPAVVVPGDVNESAIPPAPGGTETVLLVEDEPGVRALARKALESGGYTVLEATHGEEAMAVFHAHGGLVHLLLTDVVMPRLGGRDLSGRLAPLLSGLRVVYMSGYTDDAVIRNGVLEAESEFLQKPFTRDALLRKVRMVLDGPAIETSSRPRG